MNNKDLNDQRPIHSIEDIFNDPAAKILLQPAKPKPQTSYDPEIEKLQEVEKWVQNHHGQEPKKTSDLSRLHERGLASWLIGVRRDEERLEYLKPYDKLGLLKEDKALSLKDKVEKENKTINSIDDILNSDSVLLNNNQNTLNSKLFDTGKLDRIKIRQQENAPRNKSGRTRVKDFAKYKPLFENVQKDLASGRRKLVPFKKYDIELHKFYVLNGQLLYIESAGSEFNIKNRSKKKTDKRLHVVYENGTENYPLKNGLAASLYGSKTKRSYGKMVSEPNDTFKFGPEDQVTGYIYVLRSLSNNADVRRIQEDHPLYKVGFTSGTVEHRIANAENESTYLYGPVKVVAEYEVINLNPEALETALHHALAQYRLDVDIKAANGKVIHPREWFVADLETINDLINEIISKLQINE